MNDDDVVPVVTEKLNESLEWIIEKCKDRNEHTLIIIDDCANLHYVKVKATQLRKLAFHGRHLKYYYMGNNTKIHCYC